MSIMEYNGSGIVAMTGRECVAIASDMRYGSQFQMMGSDFKKSFRMGSQVFVGLAGLETDVLSFQQKLDFRLKLYRLREEREIKPSTLSALISNMLYEKRFGPWFVNPVIAGLDETGKPFVAAQDLIGAEENPADFVVAGTSSEQLFGMAEALYKPDQEPEDLFELISQCLLAAVDRDCYAGWGAEVHVITKDKIISKRLKARQD